MPFSGYSSHTALSGHKLSDQAIFIGDFGLLRIAKDWDLVGAPGFEPGTSCAQGRRATRLRYAPTPGNQ